MSYQNRGIPTSPMGMPPTGESFPPEMLGMGASTPTQVPKATPEEAKYLALVRDLTEASSILVVKVATCKCDKKDSCKVFLHSQRIAELIDSLSEIAKERAQKIPETKKKVVKKRAKSRR